MEMDVPSKPEDTKPEEVVIHTLLYGRYRSKLDIKQALLQLEKGLANK
jgi:hypothetical protein